jgi:hypothetical protein
MQKDLMIGDKLKTVFSQKIVKVKEIKQNCIYTEDNGYEYNEIEPISITPEILEKYGFVLKSDGWLWCKEEGIEEQNYIFIQFRKGCDDVRLVELNFVNKVLAKYEQIHYFHELQHALRLCGIEKEIEL